MIETGREPAAHTPRPVLREPEALVEGIYEVPGTDGLPDLASQDVMGEYLIDRFASDEGPKTRIIMVPTGKALPAIERVPAGERTVTGWRRTDEWLIPPKVAAVVVLGSAALFNGVGNHETAEGAARRGAHEVIRVFHPVEDTTVTDTIQIEVPGREETLEVTFGSGNKVGEFVADPAATAEFIDDIKQAETDGAELTGLHLQSNASDEFGTVSSIGAVDQGNTELGAERARAIKEALQQSGVSIDESLITTDHKEHVVPEGVREDLAAAAKDAGYDSIYEAVQAVDRGEAVGPSLGQKIRSWFTAKSRRGVTVSATVQYPAQSTTVPKEVERVVEGQDSVPEVPEPRFWGFIPMLPIRKRERYTKMKQIKRLQFTPSRTLYKPELLREDQDQAWIRVRPEAINEDGTFKDNPWAFTRKYEHLLRDNRIVDLLRADYKDARGDDRSLRVMFVDQSPAQETVEMFEGLLKKFASMEDGKLGSRVSGIFVYPSESAGTGHGNPKRIAIGIDKQRGENVQGTFTYALDLVEMHMPTTLDPDELQEMFEAFNGPAWVAAHEVAGHGTDESDETLRVRRIRTRNIPNAHVIDGDPRAQKMSRLEGVLRPLADRIGYRRKPNEPIQFDISYPVLDNNGAVVTMHERVEEGDPRLAHATHSTIVGYQPTRYAGTNEGEHYAETAASVTTGIPVPYSEADVHVPLLNSDDGETASFADGYRPDNKGQQVFTNSVGGLDGVYPIAFEENPDVEVWHINPENDPLIREERIRTARLRTLKPDQMTAILARVARSSSSAQKGSSR